MNIKAIILASSVALLAAYAPPGTSTPFYKASASEVVGTPAPDSKFSKINVGMYSKQVMDLIGQPTDQKTYMTGKAWIPFHFGGDNARTEYHYKGEGTLTFAHGGVGDMTSQKLIKITVNPSETGYVH